MPPKFKYGERAMEMAIKAVMNGMSKRLASKTFGVPRSTLGDKVGGRTPIGRRMGHLPYLTEQEEMELVEWIKLRNLEGVPTHKDDIFERVQTIIMATPGRVTPFKDGKPGVGWLQGFLKRHDELAIRLSGYDSKDPVNENPKKRRSTICVQIKKEFKNSTNSGNTSSDIFVPELWGFENHGCGELTDAGSSFEENSNEMSDSSVAFDDSSSSVGNSQIPDNTKQVGDVFQRVTNFPLQRVISSSGSAINHISNDENEDEFKLFGISVGAQLKTISNSNPMQGKIARKLINDTLFLASINNLDFQSLVTSNVN